MKMFSTDKSRINGNRKDFIQPRIDPEKARLRRSEINAEESQERQGISNLKIKVQQKTRFRVDTGKPFIMFISLTRTFTKQKEYNHPDGRIGDPSFRYLEYEDFTVKEREYLNNWKQPDSFFFAFEQF